LAWPNHFIAFFSIADKVVCYIQLISKKSLASLAERIDMTDSNIGLHRRIDWCQGLLTVMDIP
jgi:hypothetical protein